jgi:hypothetical protein
MEMVDFLEDGKTQENNMSKYSLVKLMESDEDGITGRVALSQDIVIYPKGETTINQIENALKDKANYKGIFTELSPNELEKYFGPQALPNVKRSMETLFPTLSKEEWMAKFSKYKGLEEKYKTLEDNNGKFYFRTPTNIEQFKQELKNLGEFVYVLDGDSLRFSQSENSKKGIILSQLESSLNKILNNAGLQFKLRYEYSK